MTGPRLTDAQRIAWLRLIRAENVGPVTFRDLVNHYGGAEAALDALPQLSIRGGRGRGVRIPGRAEAEAELATAAKAGARLVTLGETGYPPLLATLEAPPPVLYIKGLAELLTRPIVAIVGARTGSAAGQQMTRLIADELGREGFVIASGLARGIDGAAHRAALERGTIAVVAGGIDVIYPPEHAELTAEIGKRGLIVTELPPGFQPRGVDFPRRNRIISGMALGLVVVEAARRSGSLITARFAGEQGREVFAVPGHPLDPRAEGTNRLIREGATLVTSAADVIEGLAPLLRQPLEALRPPEVGESRAEPVALPVAQIGEDDRGRVLAVLGPAPVAVDEVVQATGLGIRQVRVVLIELDLAGRLERHGGNRISLRLPD